MSHIKLHLQWQWSACICFKLKLHISPLWVFCFVGFYLTVEIVWKSSAVHL